MMVAKKRIAAVALLLVIMVGIAFAAPLKAVGGFGDARIYDDNYKIVHNPSEVSDGYVIRTAGDSLVLSGDNIRIEVLQGSLARIIRLGLSPEFYLLDGQAEVYSSVAFVVRTTAISYSAEAGATIYVLSDDDNELAYVKTFGARATNLITGKTSTITPGQYINKPEKAETTPSPQQPEPATVPVAETESVLMSRTIEYGGFAATITAMDGEAVIEYPAFVTEEELLDAMRAVFAQYPEVANEIYISFGEPGTAYATYPAEYGEDGFNLAFGIIERELPPYLDELMAAYAAQAAAQPEAKTEEKEVLVPYETVTQPAQQPAEQASAQPEAETEEPQALEWDFSYRGVTAEVKAYIGTAYAVYPAEITNQEIDAAAAALVATYPEYTAGITYDIQRPGLAVITYPESYGPAEFEFATGILDRELPPYIDWIAASIKPEPVASTITPPAEAVVETVKTPIETSPRPVEQAQPEQKEEEKRPSILGMTIGVSAGFGEDGDYYYSPSIFNNRLGMFAKNIVVSLNPELRLGNFTLGLHLNLELKNGAFVDPFTFNTDGITNTVSSIMRYISKLGFRTNNGAFEIFASRNAELDFRSPIHESFKIGFEKEDRLTLTSAVRFGGFTFSGFVEDLEFKNKLSGRSEYAGVRASYKVSKFEVGISAVADIKSGLRNMVFYPGADIVVPVRIGSQEIEISAQVAAQIKSGKMNAILAKASIDTFINDWLILGAGAAFNYKSHINEIMNNGPVDVVTQFYGNSIDVTLRAGVVFGPFSVTGKMTLPLALNNESGKLVYNEVLTRSNTLASITADTMDIQADLDLGGFKLAAGVISNGFTGRLSNFFKAMINKEGRSDALKAFLDPEFSTYYALATYTTEIGVVTLDTFARFDLMRVGGFLSVPFSAGFGVSF